MLLKTRIQVLSAFIFIPVSYVESKNVLILGYIEFPLLPILINWD